MRKIFGVIVLSFASMVSIGYPLYLVAEDVLPRVPSRDMQRAIDSRDTKIKELEERIRGLQLKLDGFGSIYNACEGLSRMPVAPEPIPVRPFTPETKTEEKK